MPNDALNCIKHHIKWAWHGQQRTHSQHGTHRSANKQEANDAQQISRISHIAYEYIVYGITHKNL